MDDIDLITLNGYRAMIQNNNEAAQGRARRSRMNVLQVLDETQQDNIRLIKAERALREENDRALELVRSLADRSEAFRRLAKHLREAWNPTDPAELPLKESLNPSWTRRRTKWRAMHNGFRSATRTSTRTCA